MKNSVYLVVTHRPYPRHSGLFRDLASHDGISVRSKLLYYDQFRGGESWRNTIPTTTHTQIKLSLQATNLIFFPDFIVNNMVYCEKVYVVKRVINYS